MDNMGFWDKEIPKFTSQWGREVFEGLQTILVEGCSATRSRGSTRKFPVVLIRRFGDGCARVSMTRCSFKECS